MNRIRSLRFLLLPLLLVWLGAAADGAVPALGSPAPNFKLQDQNGKWHELKDYRGKWVALYFYPKDQTPGCTTQACDFRDNIFAYREAGAVILGISVDDIESHKAFAEKHGLPFSLLADPTKQTASRYGVMNFTANAYTFVRVWQKGGDVLNEDRTQYAMNQEAAVAAVKASPR